MSEIKDGGPAFPICQWNGDSHAGHMLGMSLRDWFAGQALKGMLSNSYRELFPHTKAEDYALSAYVVADSMIKERARQ